MHQPWSWRDNINQGILIWIKNSITGDESGDVLNYRAENPEFPYDPTLNRFFSEAQFSSYRRLGVHSVTRQFQFPNGQRVALDLRTNHSTIAKYSTRELFEGMYNSGQPLLAEHETLFAERHLEFNTWLSQLRGQEQLPWLADEIFGSDSQREVAARQPRTPDQERAERRMAAEMFTLLEATFRSLDLRKNWRHPRYAGWAGQFGTWANSPTLRRHWQGDPQSSLPPLQTLCDPQIAQFVNLLFEKQHHFSIDPDFPSILGQSPGSRDASPSYGVPTRQRPDGELLGLAGASAIGTLCNSAVNSRGVADRLIEPCRPRSFARLPAHTGSLLLPLPMIRHLLPRRIVFLVVALTVGSHLRTTLAAEQSTDFFEQKIRPLLVERCQACHSSATGKTSGGLALDTRQGWATGGDNGPAIVPGKPEESLLLKAITYTDPDLQMPPAGKGERLTADEVAAVTEWIKAGAIDPRVAGERIGGMSADEARQWWSWQPLRPVAVPPVRETTWPQTDLDRFILASLEREGLPHAGPADRRTLIRRVTFNLTGLPPTPAEIRDFLADDQPGAFDRVIDRLLASEAYGERWGRHWLDVARYADTAGDGADYPVREAFRYRDWVVRAFQKDLPFDEFLRLQIAGDLLAPSRPADEYADCITATGFLAVGKRYGYAPNPDYQHLDFADVIDSVGRSLLGLSLGCARCHDHKYDPVPMRDYYGLYGILQSTRWAFPGGEEHKRPIHFPPLVPPAEVARLEAERATAMAGLEAEIATLQASRGRLDGKWIAGGPDLAFESQPDGKPPAAPWLSAGPNAVGPESQSPFAHIHPAGQRGVRVGSGQQTDGIRYVFPQKLKKTPGGKFFLTVDFRTAAGADQPGAYRFYLGRGVIESLALEFSVTRQELALKNGTAWEVIRPIEPGVWHTLQAVLDPDQQTWSGVVGPAGDLTEFRDKKLNPAWDGILDTFICDGIGHVAGPAPARDIDNLGLQAVPFPPPGSDPVPPFVPPADAAEQLARLAEQIKQKTAERDAWQSREIYPTAYGVSEGTATNARLQKRGEPDQPGEEIPRQYLTILGGDRLPEGTTGSGRLELAEWLTRSQHPLAARVFVNRVWGWHFGLGLVTTASDFGSRGELPSHPELLEWLTGQFLQSGGSLKALHRLILRSAVYQLSSEDLSEGLARDPGNRWLWRHPRQPLDAESIRDAMLFVSGRLERGPAGPHPFPPTHTWAFTIHQPFHAVYDSNHRSLYLMQQRNRRHPFLALFDSADPNQSVAQRLPTVTPTQTLYLMNSPFVHEQASAFATRTALPGLAPTERARQMIEAAHGREADDAELEMTSRFLAQYASRLPAETGPAEREASAWQAFARVLLTGNAFLSVD